MIRTIKSSILYIIADRDGVGYSWDIISGLEWISRDIAAKQAAKGRRAKSVINMSLGGERDEIQTDVEIAMLDLGKKGKLIQINTCN